VDGKKAPPVSPRPFRAPALARPAGRRHSFAQTEGSAMTASGKAAIAFQGEPGAYSNLACSAFAPDFAPLACPTFEDALDAVRSGAAARAMLPIENSLAGRVADIHHLLPGAGLNIVGEHFLAIHHQLLACKGARIEDLKVVRSHAMALGQARGVIRRLTLKAEAAGDTAGAARRLAESGRMDAAVIASEAAAELYGLAILERNVEDAGHNTTRFLVLAREPFDPPADVPAMTTFVFQVRNIPAALYKALGGFATNGVNITKLESYQLDGAFTATMFYADVEGRPEDPPLARALEELSYFSTKFKLIGVYPAARSR
jgi:prephenate dehydratase